ncbi:Hint domain-containing protein [Acetobacter fallax]|uniref:Hedgehog/Intein (Hint) domain-containing protein n=1 Tax=Acetobacter fallax TaxID=1737473 RepID=A0ABX0K7K6_9PROT|nr:Hint domain-containing protein [Acetobacter fallax]NHO32392.1 hypothetical protein [Acetobacter fallax]NHO35940.1 hypothetical protein [Acetobacter fallax]
MLDSTKTNTSSALTATAATSGGTGTEVDPYILEGNSGTITLASGKWYVLPDNVTVGTAVTKDFNSSASTGGINVNGAHLDIKTGAHVAGTIDMSGTGSTLVLENTSGKWAYQANMAGEDLSAGGDQFYTYPSLQNATIANFGSGAGLCAQNVPGGYGSNVGIGGSDTTSSTLIIKQDSAIPVTGTPANPQGNPSPGYIGVPVTVEKGCPVTYFHTDKNDSCQIDGCFLPGTHILTRNGEKQVETLSEGDEIAVLTNGEIAYRPLAWLGRSHADVAKLGFDQDAYPVRIVKDAFGTDAPHRDLLVTSEHCVYVDGRFIPVRMLVNGRSIIVERSMTSYDFYHVELDEHAVIVSEGLLSESYLDTGNRGTFENSVIRSMRPHFAGGLVIAGGKDWQSDAAAPLTTDRDMVEPIWKNLATRAGQLGMEMDAARVSKQSVVDPDIRLVTEDGREIRPVRHIDRTYCFMVPASVETVRVVTNAARPSEAIGPFCDDRRTLGVLIGNIFIANGRERHALTACKDADAVDGWHVSEGGVGRWTAGDALLSLGLASEGLFAKMVEIEVLSAGPYLIDVSDVAGIQVA